MEAIHSGQVGVYELTKTPERELSPKLIAMADHRLGLKGWNRVATVLEASQMVLVYTLDDSNSTGKRIDAFVIVIDDRNLVTVSARGYAKPLMELAIPSTAPTRPLSAPPPWAKSGS